MPFIIVDIALNFVSLYRNGPGYIESGWNGEILYSKVNSRSRNQCDRNMAGMTCRLSVADSDSRSASPHNNAGTRTRRRPSGAGVAGSYL